MHEAEFVCNSLVGFNFGDGHLHNEEMIAAVQRQAAFEPGELIVVWVESQAWGSSVQHYEFTWSLSGEKAAGHDHGVLA